MDIEEFERQVQPRAKRSRLEPFRAQIFELKAKGYANWQVCEWLAANGLKVSQEAVRKFIKSREQTAVNEPGSAASAQPQQETPAVVTDSPAPKKEGETDSDIADPADLSAKQRRERRASQYIKPESANPILKSLTEKKQ